MNTQKLIAQRDEALAFAKQYGMDTGVSLAGIISILNDILEVQPRNKKGQWE